jgi:hypothetical protein
MKTFKIVSVAALVSSMLMNSAFAAPKCSLDNYQNKVKDIHELTRAEEIAIGIPMVPGAFLSWAGCEADAFGVCVAGMGLMGVGGLEYGLFYLIKKGEARHFQEVVNNLLGAEGDAKELKAIDHTTKLIDKSTQQNYTPEQVSKAILDAMNDGALCREDGTLAVTDDFRQIIERYLAQNS